MSAVHPFAWHNDRLVPCASLALSPLQAGLLTGWGLFSTLRIYRGVPFALEDHWARLLHDGERLQVEVAPLWDALVAGIEALVERNQAHEAVLRLYLVRNEGGLVSARAAQPTDLLLFTLPLRVWGSTARLLLQPHGRHAAAPLAGTKTLTWSHNLVLVERAHARGCDDCLLLNERDEVAECTSANIFLEQGGALLTPPLSSGALAGISRKVLLEAGPRHGLPVREAVLTTAALEAAGEVFITSSTREVQPVSHLDGRPLPAGPWSARAATVLRAEIDAYVNGRSRRATQPAKA
ncbi:MAG: aminotransferase class IV [Terriglobales bacterium]